MKKFNLFILLLALLLLGINNTSAQKLKEKTRFLDRTFNQLNLTDAQQEEFNKIKFANEEAKIELQAQLRLNRLELKKLLNQTNLDENKLISLIENGSGLAMNLKKENVAMWLKIRKILDDDQKKIWRIHFNRLNNRNDRFSINENSMRHPRNQSRKDKPAKYRRYNDDSADE